MKLAWALGLVAITACSASSDAGDEEGLEEVPEADSITTSGPVNIPGASTEVWSVTRAWTDRVEGVSWEDKFTAWVSSFKQSDGTFEIPTPYGRTLPAPTLECAEVAIMLRVTFASMNHLPFYLSGWDSKAGRTLYAGHFGFVYSDGKPVKGFPAFRVQYKDHEKTWKEGAAWPSDPALRKLRLGADDGNASLGGEGAGAYFDELFLNKRAGYFMRLALLYFGSVNLADTVNTFNIRPEATRAGDVLLERWQKRGIGHTIPVIRVESTGGEHLAIDVASGSMPRRQPKWEPNEQAIWSFTNDSTGGAGSASDGTPYAKLGGGIKRWRYATLRAGRWSNEVPLADKQDYINSTNLAAISARPARFGVIMAEGTPEEQRAAALAKIESARARLRERPASCAGRTERENAFAKLYEISRRSFGMDKGAVDDEYRALEDHVFGELDYARSKTCCWNSTTKAMADVVMAFAKEEQAAAQRSGMCVQPKVFRAEAGGYAAWSAYAQKIGKSSEWKAWSEDEPCAQRAVMDDALARTASFCR